MTTFACYDTPLGILKIGESGGRICFLQFVDTRDFESAPTPLTDLAAAQVIQYLSGERTCFDLPLAPAGTPFQQSVWTALQEIPYAQTRTYLQIAKAIGNPGSSRAVGMACRQNPLWLVIPCHRVIGSNRNLTGYAGGLARKRALLDLEHASV